MKTDKSQTITYLQTNYFPHESMWIVTKGIRKRKEDGSYKWVPADSGKIYGVEKLLCDLHNTKHFEEVIKGFNPQVGVWISANPTTRASDSDVTDLRLMMNTAIFKAKWIIGFCNSKYWINPVSVR